MTPKQWDDLLALAMLALALAFVAFVIASAAD